MSASFSASCQNVDLPRDLGLELLGIDGPGDEAVLAHLVLDYSGELVISTKAFSSFFRA